MDKLKKSLKFNIDESDDDNLSEKSSVVNIQK